jgi:hypothetical protein
MALPMTAFTGRDKGSDIATRLVSDEVPVEVDAGVAEDSIKLQE